MRVSSILGMVAGVLLAGSAWAQSVGVGTMSQGTMSYSSGSAIAKLLTEKAGVQARVQPNSGESIMIPLVDMAELDFGIANVQEADEAVQGERAFKGRPVKNLRVATVMFPLRTALFVKADSGIRTVADLKGKRVTYGFTAMGTINTIVDAILASGGLTAKDIRPIMVPNVARGADELAAGNVDAFFFAVGAAKVTEVDVSVGGLLMLPLGTTEADVQAVKKVFPYGYPYIEQPRPGVAGVSEPSAALAYDNLLLTSAAVSDELVYKSVKAIYENRAGLVASFAGFQGFDTKHMYKPGMPTDFHPGALRFFKEVGLVQP